MNFFDRIKNKIIRLYKDVRENSMNLEKVRKLPHRAYEWFIYHENRKMIISTVSVWFAVFAVIIIVCRISGNADASASVEEQTTVFELESVKETSYKGKTIVKEPQAETTSEIITPQPETEPETTVQPETEPVPVEKETISIDKLKVSRTTLKDDVSSVPKRIENIAPLNVSTIPSTKLDSSRYAQCIDISHHQGKIDWAAVKASGIDYAIIRVGYRGYETGGLGKDTRFDENIQGAIRNDIKVGVYFFSQAITEQEALEEASVTLNYIKNYKISLPVVIDWETTGGYRTYNAGLSRSRLTGILSTFCDTVERYGYEPMVYMCKSDYESRINATQIASKYKTWVAWYFPKYDTDNFASNFFKYGDDLPDMSFGYNIWQYSCKGRVNGIKEKVDMNVLILPEVKYDIKLNVSAPDIVTNINTPVDLMKGVSASGSDGRDATSEVKLHISNNTGTAVSKENALSVGGKYNLNYRFTDKDGTVVNKNAVLYVRSLPVIRFEQTVWSDNTVRSLSYDYDESMSAEDNYGAIIRLLDDKLSAVYYDIIEGVSDARKITAKEYAGIENVMTDGDIKSGEIVITYNVSDGKGLSNSKTVNLIINREQEEEGTDSGNGEMQTTKFVS